MIVVREIRKSFGKVAAVRGVSLELGAGRIVGLLGPNGAGKSTTIRMIVGVTAPDSGSVLVAGRPPGPETRAGIGYLPESAPLYPEMTPEGYLDHRARLYGLGRADRRRAVGRALDRCRVGAKSRARIGTLSKGFRQRVGLAAAIVHDPPVLILDEPTNGLDPSQIRDSRSLIRELGEDRTMILCSHILPEIERTCDRVVIISGGKVRADGTSEDLIGAGQGRDGGGRYLLEIRTNQRSGAGFAVARLRDAPGVAWIEPTEDQPGDAQWCRLRVDGAPGAGDLRESIAGAAADAGLFVRQLQPERRTLEDVFVELTEGVA